jgi:hypothetical protein
MTTTLTPRAPTPDTRPGRTWGPHAAGKMVLGAVMILAGLFASRTVTSLGEPPPEGAGEADAVVDDTSGDLGSHRRWFARRVGNDGGA